MQNLNSHRRSTIPHVHYRRRVDFISRATKEGGEKENDFELGSLKSCKIAVTFIQLPTQTGSTDHGDHEWCLNT